MLIADSQPGAERERCADDPVSFYIQVLYENHVRQVRGGVGERPCSPEEKRKLCYLILIHVLCRTLCYANDPIGVILD